MKKAFLLSIIFFLGFSCQNNNQAPEEKAPSDKEKTALAKAVVFQEEPVRLGDYWYQGKAEINHYELLQNRYQDLHPGEAVLVFVTEDFLTDKQVKNDTYRNPNSTPVLKTNFLRKFPTGLYDYSIMTSVFTPTKVDEFPNTLKVSTTAQDWCGHTFMQLNHMENEYQVKLHSYFENEADAEYSVDHAILEDELFNRIRMNPESLPLGEIRMLPSTVFARLKHSQFSPQEATASMAAYTGSEFPGEDLKNYKVVFPKLNRTLEIIFENKSPYKIAGWKDAYPSMFDGKIRTSIAVRTNTLYNAYWKKNSLEDMRLREDLGMEAYKPEVK